MRSSLLSWLLLLPILGCGSAQQTTPKAEQAPQQTESTHVLVEEIAPEGQLPRHTLPLAYRIDLDLNPRLDHFAGKIEIDIQTLEPRRTLWLHGQELNVHTTRIVSESAKEILGHYKEVNDQGVVKLSFDDVIPAGKHTLFLEYHANYNQGLKGLYKVSQKEEAYLFTQFEATSARYAFPCFDEPAFKTTFEVSITTHKGDKVAFNTPTKVASNLSNERIKHVFEPTKKLPTYLVAMTVGPLEIVEADAIPANAFRSRPLPFRAISTRGKAEKLAYAIKNTAALVESLEKYFGREYPYAKLDIVAVPDFAAGAMENAGLITFRETLLLLNDDAPLGQKKAFAGVMAHELAHQWFGNLVTMYWWDDIWLNEAFATWMGNKAVHDVIPEYEADINLLRGAQHAMSIDSLTSARQIRQPIESNHDIRNAFDSITYRKGGGVLSMFEQWLGEDVFKKGIQTYINKHEWANANYEDLLAALDEASGKNVSERFKTFLFQPGVPFVSTSMTCEKGKFSFELEQKRYLPAGSGGDSAKTWQLPICIRHGRGRAMATTCTVMESQKQSVPVEGSCPEWYLPNADGAGYLRFSMSANGLRNMRKKGLARINAKEKLALADSLIASFKNGAMDAKTLYPLLIPLTRGDEKSQEQAVGVVNFAIEHMLDTRGSRKAREYIRKILGGAARNVNWKPSSDLEKAQSTARTMALIVRDPKIRRDAQKYAHRYLGYRHSAVRDEVAPEMVGTILKTSAEMGDQKYVDFLIETLLKSDDALLRKQILGALVHVPDEQLDMVFSLLMDERVRQNELLSPFFGLASRKETRDRAWTWFTANYDAVAKRFDSIMGYAPYLGSNFCSEARAKEVASFFAGRAEKIPGAPRNLAISLEAVRLCAAQSNTQKESTKAYFK